MCKLFLRPDRNAEIEREHCEEVIGLKLKISELHNSVARRARQIVDLKELNDISCSPARSAFLKGFTAGQDNDHSLVARVIAAQTTVEEI